MNAFGSPSPGSRQADEKLTTIAIFAPHGRDAQVALKLLEKEGYDAVAVDTLSELGSHIRNHIGCILMTEEAMASDNLAVVQEAIADQPSWSDLPFVVLSNGTASQRSRNATSRIDTLRNVILLSRPLHAEELIRAINWALAARVRQVQARQHVEEIELRESQLLESETRFHTIVNSVDQMIWSTRPDGFHDFYNDRWYEYTGVPKNSTDGDAWNGMFHEEDQERSRRIWQHSLDTGEPYEIEYRLRHRSGAYRWVLGRAQPVRGPDGTIKRWYGTCTDIHDEVVARTEEVHELTKQRDTAWDLTEDLLAVVAQDGSAETVNAAWQRQLGYAPEELIGKTFEPLLHPDDMDETVAAFDNIENDPVAKPYENRLRHKDGSYLTFVWSATMRNGRIYAFGRNVTEERAREAALAETEAALRQSQKLEMIGQLTGGVAHDFNNLLMAIQSSLNLLQKRLVAPSDEVSRFIDNARQATERGARLTQRMLAFARKQDLNAHVVDVGALVPDMRDLLQRSLGAEIELELAVAEDVAPALVDRNQLEMAILNLAVNSRDALDGTGTISITFDEVDWDEPRDLEPGRYVRISVSDNGSGMDSATLSQAMEPFFTTKGVGKGTGLGLSMVHGLAKQSGGTFIMESSLGEGTKACLLLPVAEQDAETGEAEAEAEEQQTKTDRRRVILAVDDDFLVSMGTVAMLEDLGHEVIEAHSGAEALTQLSERPDIELIVTDQAMPKMTGVELAQQVRESRPDMPIILATGYADMPEGGAKYITAKLDKPFSDAGLAKVLGDVLKG